MPSFVKLMLSLAAAAFLVGCLVDSEKEKIVYVGGPDTALLASEGLTLNLRFYPRFGSDTLKTGRKYRTSGGDSVRFEMAKLYVSAIALVDSTGKSHPLIGTHLVDMLDSGAQARGYAILDVKALPGTYRGIRFTVGVPFDENHRDPATQTAPLGTESGMFWSWNSGYIFHRVEAKVDSAGVEKALAYHIGGDNRALPVNLFGLSGTDSIRIVMAEAAHTAKVAHGGTTHLPIYVSYDALFSTGLNTSSALKPSVNVGERQAHGGAIADRVFLNMQSMFSLTASTPAPSGMQM
jgi:hypothetical protein